MMYASKQKGSHPAPDVDEQNSFLNGRTRPEGDEIGQPNMTKYTFIAVILTCATMLGGLFFAFYLQSNQPNNFEKSRAEMEAKLAQATATINLLQNQKMQANLMNEKYSSLQKQQTEYESQTGWLREKVSALESKLKDVSNPENKVLSKDEQISRLQKELEEKLKSTSYLEDQISSRNMEINRLRHQIEEKHGGTSSLNQNMGVLQTQLTADLDRKISLLDEKFKDLAQKDDNTELLSSNQNQIDVRENYFRNYDPIKRIIVLGERNSGTNFVEGVLQRGFPEYGRENATRKRFSSHIPVFYYKHMMRHELLNKIEVERISEESSTLWVLVVRNPCNWADGMYRKPWHMCPVDDPSRCPGPYIKMGTFNGSRESFFQHPWHDWHESNQTRSGKYKYDNIFHLRSHKLQLMQQIIQAHPRRHKIVHLSQVELNPHHFLRDIQTQFGLNMSTSIMKQYIRKKIHFEVCLEDQEWNLAQQLIQWEIESSFGFNPSDCRTCLVDQE